MSMDMALAEKSRRTNAIQEGRGHGLHVLGKRTSPIAAGAMEPDTIKGWISTVHGRTAIEVRCASMHSMWSDLSADFGYCDIENLELLIGDDLIEIGPCYAAHESDHDGGLFRIIPFRKILNLKKLFSRARVETMDTNLSNLPLVLAYNSGIDPAFRGFISDLTYDLNTYIALLDRLDAEYEEEAPLVRETIQANVIESMSQGFFDRLDSRNRELVALLAGLGEEQQGRYGHYFRSQLWNIILRSPVLARTNLKPRGFAGDSEMMRMIYSNDYQGESTFGKLLHKYSVSMPAAQAVRNRRTYISALLGERLHRQGTSSGGKLRLLSVACGPAFEILDILKTRSDCERLQISLLDQDPKALFEASNLISQCGAAIGANISVEFIKESVRTMYADARLEKRLGRFDFIYSMGLFDYLDARVASAVIRHLFQLLSPGGEMVIGNMAADNPSKHFMEFWHDWKLIYRTGDELLGLATGLPGALAEVRYDETGIQMMLHIRNLE